MSADAWTCLGCGQRNSGWSHECGRCGVTRGAFDAVQPTSLRDDTRERLVRDVVVRETVARDAAVRQQLVALGWATPERARALSDAAVTLQREVERLRMALTVEMADRLDRALSPNRHQPPPVPPDKL